MSSPSVVILAIRNDHNFLEEDEKILHYLNQQVTKLKYKILETKILDNNDIINIENEITKWLNECDAILITGGKNLYIYNVLSKCLNEKLIVSNHLSAVYKNGEISIPRSARIYQVQDHANGIDPVCINIRNIFVFPNDLHSIVAICDRFIKSFLNVDCPVLYRKHFIIRCNEYDFLPIRDDNVAITQYFTYNDFDHCSEMNAILKSDDFTSLVQNVNRVKEMLPERLITSERICSSFWNDLDSFKDSVFVQQALNVIKECYSTYEPQNIFLCFNGGKDCTVLLYLTTYVLRTFYPDYKSPLTCLYIQSENPFPEVEEFIRECVVFFNLELFTIKDTIKMALADTLKQRPDMKTCLMGTRRTDPFAEHLNHFHMSDPEWPQIMRVSPLLDWEYSNIWDVILTCKIPYCTLYDLGYTSLGSQTNTGPNPALKIKDEKSEQEKYLPAYNLLNSSQERDGRKK